MVITPKYIYNHKKQYYSRSIIGMKQVLVIDFGLTPKDAIELIKSWIDQKLIIPTLTKDNHYILNERNIQN